MSPFLMAQVSITSWKYLLFFFFFFSNSPYLNEQRQEKLREAKQFRCLKFFSNMERRYFEQGVVYKKDFKARKKVRLLVDLIPLQA